VPSGIYGMEEKDEGSVLGVILVNVQREGESGHKMTK